MKLPKDAEDLIREYVAIAEPKNPTAALVLADLARHANKVEESLTICSASLARVDPEIVARVSVAVTRLGNATDSQFAKAESIIRKAAEARPGSSDIPLSLADLRDAQARYEDAEKMYRDILRTNSRNVLAMNNLAWLLALRYGKERRGPSL